MVSNTPLYCEWVSRSRTHEQYMYMEQVEARVCSCRCWSTPLCFAPLSCGIGHLLVIVLGLWLLSARTCPGLFLSPNYPQPGAAHSLYGDPHSVNIKR